MLLTIVSHLFLGSQGIIFTEELDEPRDDPDRIMGLDRRADPGNKTETQLENSETTPWDLSVMPAPDAGTTTETREQMPWSEQYNVPALDATSQH